ncbi:hypothetical protein [Lichenifustis flavocetrariae]|uniref:Uncharacterized protein n=1 Tax=Lichenifustis flavocetrariae TaxID=2949735 RepID=A0AA42CMV8_9HYPH|nr:hypothetical protein [Lichenifustis flavocetrariae]MCW6512918.1 hypothetical protein [Lichenifustis flavocetrariae]
MKEATAGITGAMVGITDIANMVETMDTIGVGTEMMSDMAVTMDPVGIIAMRKTVRTNDTERACRLIGTGSARPVLHQQQQTEQSSTLTVVAVR